MSQLLTRPWRLLAVMAAVALVAIPLLVRADSVGPTFPSSTTGTCVNPSNGFSNDGTVVDCRNDQPGSPSEYDPDAAIYSNFVGLSVPAGATIDGIAVTVRGYKDSTVTNATFQVRLSGNGGSTWTIHKSTTQLTTTAANYTLGGAADLWGGAWTDASFSAPNFRLEIRPGPEPLSTGRQWHFDFVSVTVYYTPVATDSTPPVITPNVSGTLGNNGWYTSDVTVSWTVVDNESSVTSTTGCDDTTIDSDTTGVTLTCSATSSGGTASESVTIKRDATAPTITITVPPDGASYDYGDAVNANFTCNDGTSGIASCTGTVPDGSAIATTPVGPLSFTVNAEDNAGNTATLTHNYTVVDPTPPVITPNVSGTLGNNGWYTSDVTVSWTVVDNESSVTSTTGCDDTTIDSDTTGVTLTCSATSSGGTASESVTIKRDATPPTITGSASPVPNVYGWNNSDVFVAFSCSDAMSGVASCGPDVTLTTEGMAQSVIGTAVDNAGNTATDTVSGINIDKTAPTISGSASPAANANGWNNTDVTVTFTCGDALSGVLACEPDVTLTGEGSGQSVTGTAEDYAGNTATDTVSGINIDKTAPTISGSASPAANANGWNNTDVTVAFTCADSLSGIDVCPDAVVLSSEGAGQSASGTAYDKAGNDASTTVSGINIDKTAPDVSLVGGPADGGSYYFGSVPAPPTCTASDALSGLDGSCSVSGYSNAVGTHTVTASATDKAGNTSSASVTYTVLGWTTQGYFNPVNMNALNTVKGGSTVPLKFRVFAGATELTSTSVVKSFQTQLIQCSGGALEDAVDIVTTGGTSLRYDTDGGQFIQNWQTPKQPGKCYRATVTFQDGSSISADFKLK
jgi:hypothetical protein